MDAEVNARFIAEGRGRVRVINLACGCYAGEVFVAIELVRRGVPHRRFFADAELGQLLGDVDVTCQRGLFGQFVAEADARIEGAEPNRHLSVGAVGGLEGDGEFIVLVAHQTALAPRLFPRGVAAGAGRSGDGEAAFEPVVFGKQHPELGRGNDLLAFEADRIGRLPAIILDRDGDLSVR